MKKLNNKGFTLVELLAVVVILVVIMMIAIPNISSSIERSKNKQKTATEKIIISAAELYISANRGSLASNTCYIKIETLISENYLDKDSVEDYNDKYIIYTPTTKTIVISESISGLTECIS